MIDLVFNKGLPFVDRPTTRRARTLNLLAAPAAPRAPSHVLSARSLRAAQYGEFRRGFRLDSGAHDKDDTRLVFYGMRHIVSTYMERRWTREDIDAAAAFYRRACAACGVPQRSPR